jgi:hypothetical protein
MMYYASAVVTDGVYELDVPVMNGYNVALQLEGFMPLFAVTYDDIYTGGVQVYKLPNTNNVGYTYFATPLDFECKPVTAYVNITTTTGYVENPYAEGELTIIVWEGMNPQSYVFEFTTDAEGKFTAYIPEAYLGEIVDEEAESIFDIEYWSDAYYSIAIDDVYNYSVIDPGYYEFYDEDFYTEYNLAPFAYFDYENDVWTLKELYLYFASVEYRMVVDVVADDFGVADMPIIASENGKHYYNVGVTDENGYLVVDGVDFGTYFKVQTGDDFKPVKAQQFIGDDVTFVLTYVVDPTPQPEDDVYTLFVNGKRMKDLEAGQAYTVALMNDANGAKIVVSNINKNQTIFLADQKNTVFKYWRLADGSTSTLEAITFVAGGDQVKAVGNQYAFTAVFEDSTKIVVEDPDNADTPVEPEDNKKGIDTTVLILGAVAVAIAVIAVVAAVVVGRK